jgi:F-type H+-transporting ATPase subunit delta
VAREFRRLYNRREGIFEATATSAAKLDDEEVNALRSRLEQMTGGKVELTFNVDPLLLGGVQVRLGDLLIDGSVRGRLERLRTKLESGVLTP